MRAERLTGHNVVHLIYPLRRKNTRISVYDDLKDNFEWEEILSSEIQNNDQHNNNIKYIFPENYSTDEFDQQGCTYRKWVDSKYFYSYFHPSVQKALFHKGKRLHVFRKKKVSSDIYEGDFYRGAQAESIESIQFEWISSEIYVFSLDTAYLVVRVSLNENVKLGINGEEVFDKPIQKLNVWMKFLNRIRQNYSKYEGQERLVVRKKGTFNNHQHNDQKFFFHYVDEFIKNNSPNLVISSISHEEITGPLAAYQCIEPNTYVHAFVQSDMASKKWTQAELQQMLYIDDSEGESGKDNRFRAPFFEDHVYTRWAPDTYYTSIDYGSVTIANTDNYCYNTSTVKKYSFSDVLYQHHTRHYLFLILLQYYYRDQMQELLVQYSNLTDLTDKKESKKVLDSYYNLNQHFFFDRITNEIQGMELWGFYQKIMGIKELHTSVREDMKELNQRIIENIGDRQNNDIQTLTVIAALTGMFGMNLIIPRADDDYIFAFLLEVQWVKSIVGIMTGVFNGITVIIIGWVLVKLFRHFGKWIQRKLDSGE
ncbi:hypothetical protein COA08_10240 [Bacillus cereus]|uniref:Group-specific protein n=1 Tax=Bacillus cereus TaxID=1396 RepID=A0A2A8U064_BACCE|nr:hypothetical protein [Bacillus cereus]PFA10290.1 hypothetical protein CN382_20660 [Bacillus cereus]PGQ10524.1 hypothetical protein COA08_10240 [Bacillus cereus]